MALRLDCSLQLHSVVGNVRTPDAENETGVS